MKFVCPLIVVENIERSRNLYESILGLKVIADFGENITFEGPFSLHLKTHYQTLIDHKDISFGSNAGELYFESNGLESLADKLQQEELEFVHDICEQPWRQKVMRVYDYDKHILEIGESMEHTAWRLSQEGLSIEAICKLTYLSEEMVEKSIKRNGK